MECCHPISLYVSHHFSAMSALTHYTKFNFRRFKAHPLNKNLYPQKHIYRIPRLQKHPFGVFVWKGNFRLNWSSKPVESKLENAQNTEEKEEEDEGWNPNSHKESLDNMTYNKIALTIGEFLPPEGFMVVVACVVGLLTGIAVVLFNLAVHEICDFFWDGIPSSGASFLREQSLEQKWQRILFTPACGGVVVAILNTIRSSLESSSAGIHMSDIKASFRSFLKTAAATITLGTGNSLGPEGPSVEIGASIASGMGKVLQSSLGNKLSLVATGSAAGISSGFNAPVAGCFFAVESVLWPSSANLSTSLTNTTSMVGMAAVLAGVCQVPLTSVLLLFELTHDYRIIIPLMAAVGSSSWISSALTRKESKKQNDKKSVSPNYHNKENKQFQKEKPFFITQQSNSNQSLSPGLVQCRPTSEDKFLSTSGLHKLESSLCAVNPEFQVEQLEEVIPVVVAMRTHYVTVAQHTSLQDAMSLMLSEKEWCALVVEKNRHLKGILTLGDIQEYGEMARLRNKPIEIATVPVSEVCTRNGGRKGMELLTVFPHTSLKAAQQLMSIHGLRQLPVVTEAAAEMDQVGPLVGLIDRECINLACRAEVTKRIVGLSCVTEDSKSE